MWFLVEAGDIMDAEKERFASDEISSPRSRRSMTASSTRQHPYMLTPRFIVHVISVTITYNVMNLFLLLAYDHALNIGKRLLYYRLIFAIACAQPCSCTRAVYW